MKKNKKEILIIFSFSILVMLPYFFLPYIMGHDTEFHVANINAIVKNLRFSHIFVQEPLPFIANNFGYGTRFFYPPLPHLTAAYITKIIGGNIILAMRLTQWLTIFFSGITSFFLVKKMFHNKKIALFSSFAYMTTPYHLSQIFIRDAFSEMFFTLSVPLILLGLFYLIEDNKKSFYICFVSGYTLAIYSHIAMSVYFTILILLTFFLIYKKQIFTKKNIFSLCGATVLILLLTSSFWLPLLEIKLKGKYGVFIPHYMVGKGSLQFSTLPLLDLFNFLKPHTFSGIRHYSSFFILLLGIGSFYLILKEKLWKEKIVQFILIFLCVSIIMVSKIFPWSIIPDILSFIQFPWRLTLMVSFAMIMLSCLFLQKIQFKKKFNFIFWGLSFLCLISSYYTVYHLDEKQIELQNINYNKGVGNQSEYLPKNTLEHMEYYENRSQEIIVKNGKSSIEILKNEVPDLLFKVESDRPLTLELPRLYYFGYKLYHNKEKIALKENEFGFIETDIKESGEYKLVFEKTPIMKISLFLSGLTLIFCFVFLYKAKYKMIKA